MIDYLTLSKNFQSLVASYQDVSTIYGKLEAQGHLEKISNVFVDVYNEEHEFTLNELKKYGKENNQNEEEFLLEQYELNSTIFRRNFALIIQNIADEIGRNFLEKFKRTTEVDTKSRGRYSRAEIEYFDEQKYPPLQKPQYKSDMPEIQEEAESAGKISPLKSSSTKTKKSDIEFMSGSARNFQLNIEELGQRTRMIQETTPWTTVQTSHTQRGEELNSHRVGSPEHLHKYDLPFNGISGVSPLNGARKIESSRTALTRTLNTDQFKQPLMEQRQSKESFRSLEVSAVEGGGGHSHSYPRSFSQERVSHSSNTGNASSTRGLSPSNKTGKSVMTSVSSKYSGIGMIDPNFLDSEFSYAKGTTFSKTERTGLANTEKIPGPGYYEPDAGLKAVKKRSPISSFPKSPKFSMLDKAGTDSPGAIYHPTHHFLSKHP